MGYSGIVSGVFTEKEARQRLEQVEKLLNEAMTTVSQSGNNTVEQKTILEKMVELKSEKKDLISYISDTQKEKKIQFKYKLNNIAENEETAIANLFGLLESGRHDDQMSLIGEMLQHLYINQGHQYIKGNFLLWKECYFHPLLKLPVNNKTKPFIQTIMTILEDALLKEATSDIRYSYLYYKLNHLYGYGMANFIDNNYKQKFISSLNMISSGGIFKHPEMHLEHSKLFLEKTIYNPNCPPPIKKELENLLLKLMMRDHRSITYLAQNDHLPAIYALAQKSIERNICGLSFPRIHSGMYLAFKTLLLVQNEDAANKYDLTADQIRDMRIDASRFLQREGSSPLHATTARFYFNIIQVEKRMQPHCFSADEILWAASHMKKILQPDSYLEFRNHIKQVSEAVLPQKEPFQNNAQDDKTREIISAINRILPLLPELQPAGASKVKTNSHTLRQPLLPPATTSLVTQRMSLRSTAPAYIELAPHEDIQSGYSLISGNDSSPKTPITAPFFFGNRAERNGSQEEKSNSPQYAR